MNTYRYFVVAALFLLVGPGLAQQKESSGRTTGTAWIGKPGITESVAQIMAGGVHDPSLKSEKTGGASVSDFGSTRNTFSQPVETLSPLGPQTIGVDFRGVRYSDAKSDPPDCSGAVGPSQILVCVNGFIRSFTKNGLADGVLDLSSDAFFNSVRNGATTSFPRVAYDRLSQRWFIIMVNDTLMNSVVLAVSSGPVISSSASFTFYSFTAAGAGLEAFPPTLGVDAHALYIGADVWDGNTGLYQATKAFVVRKSSATSGGPIVVTAFTLSTVLGGIFAPQGVSNDDSSSGEGYFIGINGSSYTSLLIKRVTDPGGTPSISASFTLTVPTTSYPINVPAKGSTDRLLGNDNRLSAAIMKNGSLWTSQTIGTNASGVATTDTSRRDAVRFYEIKNLTTTPTLNQSGTVFDSIGASPRYFWNASIATSGQGHTVIGSSYAGLNDYAGVAYVGRLSTDPPGTVQSTTFFASSTAYNESQLYGYYFWGRYSSTVVDPNDNMTIWTAQEYCDTSGLYGWGVRVTQLKAPPPATPSGASPDSVRQGAAHVNVIVDGTSVNGSGFYDPGSGFPSRISATVSGAGVTVDSITYTDPTHLTLNISVDSGAAAGTRTMTVTNPDSQTATSATGILTITPMFTLITFDVPVMASWNLVSNPLLVANDSASALFPDAVSPAFAYDPVSGYEVSPRVVNGAGYWLRFDSSGEEAITGYPLASESVAVSDGWNLIGSIGQAVPTLSITSSPPGMITSKFFAYQGGYTVSDSIKPGQGYWVKVSGSGRLVLSSSGSSLASDRIRMVATSELPPPPPEGNTESGVLPRSYALSQAFPSPFNPTTSIRYQLPDDSKVTLTIYNLLGQTVATIIDNIEPAGYKQVEWNGSNFASGVYFYRLDAVSTADPEKSFTSVKKMVLIR